jgi:hypothetical protein
MPVLHVRALPQKDPDRVGRALEAACVAIAQAYGCRPEHVWATWEEIRPGRYVEGGSAARTQPDDTHPPIAQLICLEGKSAEEIERVLVAGARALAEALGIPGNVFMTYVEAASGTVVAGDGAVWRRR